MDGRGWAVDNVFTERLWRSLKYKYAAQGDQPRDNGLLPRQVAAACLGLDRSVLADWFRAGLISGHQRKPGAAVWVRLDPENLPRLDGSATLQTDMIPLETAPQPWA